MKKSMYLIIVGILLINVAYAMKIETPAYENITYIYNNYTIINGSSGNPFDEINFTDGSRIFPDYYGLNINTTAGGDINLLSRTDVRELYFSQSEGYGDWWDSGALLYTSYNGGLLFNRGYFHDLVIGNTRSPVNVNNYTNIHISTDATGSKIFSHGSVTYDEESSTYPQSTGNITIKANQQTEWNDIKGDYDVNVSYFNIDAILHLVNGSDNVCYNNGTGYVNCPTSSGGDNSSFNESYTNGKYISSGNLTIYNGLINNASYLSTYNATYNTYAYNMTTVPAGSNTEIQYNNNGVFGASSSFTYDGTDVNVGGAVVVGSGNQYTEGGIYIDTGDDSAMTFNNGHWDGETSYSYGYKWMIESGWYNIDGMILDGGGNLYVTGALTATGGSDPPYELYYNETRNSVLARVRNNVPLGRENGMIHFYNSELSRWENFKPANCHLYKRNITSEWDELIDSGIDIREKGDIAPCYNPFVKKSYYWDKITGSVASMPKPIINGMDMPKDMFINQTTGKLELNTSRVMG